MKFVKIALISAVLASSMLAPSISYAGHCGCTEKVKGNNGIGNGLDPQPPGDPKPNDL